MENRVCVVNVTKQFDQKNILNHVSFEAKEGEIIGILGENGVGKTTFLKLLCGLLKPEEGEIFIFNQDPWIERDKVLKKMGILIDTPIFYEHLTGYENIKIHLSYMGIQKDINEVLKTVKLFGIDEKVVSKFSLGMKQKLSIARAISHDPKILILDEPINGLDPVAIQDMRTLFKTLKEKGITIILASHILNEVLETVDKIFILSKGKLHSLQDIEQLKAKYGNQLENYLIQQMGGIKDDEAY